ncbi:MAG: tetratricopeptide repeat protein [Planctomycetes bacterium]|nr:tetratricopeptide repeat protein [Planctomycetota bacterium]
MNNRALILGAALLASAALWGCASADSAQGISESQQLLEDGREAARGNRHVEAIAYFTRAVKTNPDLAEGWYERGKSNIHFRLDPKLEGDSRAYEQKAFEDFSMAVRKNPAYADAYFNRAMIFCSRAQYKPALDDLMNAARFNPRDAEPHLWMAEVYEKKLEDRVVLAMEHYEKYVDLGGTDAAAREKVRVWKDFKKQQTSALPAPLPKSSKTPTAEEEAKAAELHQKALELLKQPDKSEAVKAIEELLAAYGHTKYVQEKSQALQAAVSIFKKKDAPK